MMGCFESQKQAYRSRLARVHQTLEYTALKFAGYEGSEFFFFPDATNLSQAGVMVVGALTGQQ